MPQATDLRARCLQEIRRLGFPAAYEVGGAVRDELAGKPVSKDIDIAVCGVGYEELVARCSTLGRAEPLEVAGQLVGVRLRARFTPKEGIEIALLRTEVSTGPRHQDFRIEPIPAAELDALRAQGLETAAACERLLIRDLERRDFTVNAMARDLEQRRLIDPFGGAADLEAGVLRTVTEHSFRDDPLRILRGLVRVSVDGLQPDAATRGQMREWAHGIGTLSAERVDGELTRILGGEHVLQALRLARDTGVLGAAVPELGPMLRARKESGDLLSDHVFLSVRQAVRHGASTTVLWAALLHDAAKHQVPNAEHPRAGAVLARTALERLKADRRRIQDVPALVREHTLDLEGFNQLSEHERAAAARRFLARHGELALELALLRRCDWESKDESGRMEDGREAAMEAFERELSRQAGAPVVVGDLAIDGEDLLALGYSGPALGEALRAMLHGTQGPPPFAGVVEDPALNSREALLAWAAAARREEARDGA